MKNKRPAPIEPTPERVEELKALATSLLDNLDSGDYTQAMESIDKLSGSRDQCLYTEVGRLTRKLHQSIRDFQVDPHNDEQAEALSKMTDASDRLGYVVEMTSEAANKTMDIVEEAMPKAAEFHTLASDIAEQWEGFKHKGYNVGEFKDLYDQVSEFLSHAQKHSEYNQGALQEILMAQGFQDLTGQVIQKVTSLVKDVEDHLLDLVVMASHVDQLAGVSHEFTEEQKQEEDSSTQGHGPQLNHEQKDDVVSGQDDVDDLLSSLGF